MFCNRDGAETDLDLGHYERFLNIYTSQENNITTAEFIKQLLKKRERVIIWVKLSK